MSKMIKSAGIMLAIMLLANTCLAKKAPSPESIISRNFAPHNQGPATPMQNEFSSDGFATRLYFPAFHTQESEPQQIVADFLRQRSSLLGLRGNDLKLESSKHSLAGYHYRYQQVWNDLPVFASQILVNITYDGTISSVISDYKQGIDISTIPSITAKTAEMAAAREVGITALRDEITSELVILARSNPPVLCWKVMIPAEKPLGDWQVFVNAADGEIVDKDNIMYFIDGSGYSFQPNPVVSEQNLMLADSSDRNYLALTNARDSVVLRDLNAPQGGYYYLTGPYVNTSATPNRARFTDPDSFFFNRQADQFEEVMAYYMLDSCERYYQSLGFDNIMQYSITLAVNGTTDDNSWFSPGQRRITYGSGGVDDAEDGDVIVHEYGHATQYDQVPGWGQTEEGGAMGEGFGDYLTVGFFHPISGNWREAYVFDWDANTRDNFWPGRRVDRNKHYPEDMDGEVHDDGEIWSRCLWDIQNDIGNDTTVQIVLESHFGLTSQATFIDGANAIVEADINLYGGAHLMPIGQSFLDRGIFSELPIHLDISHARLGDSENINGPYQVIAGLTHTNPVDSVVVYYRFAQDSLFSFNVMNPSGNPDEFAGQIPGPGQISTVNYFIRAVDSLHISNNLPAGAPGQTFQFFVGPDTIRPSLTHQPIADYPAPRWPATINAGATDNIGVDSVWVEFRISGDDWSRTPLTQVDSTNNWTGPFTGNVVPGDTVQYRLAARDRSSGGNIGYLPLNGYFSFTIIDLFSVTYLTPGFNIPDLGGLGVLDTVYIPDHLRIYEADIFVDIDHPYIGELYFFVRSPRNLQVTLHNLTGGDGDSIVGWYDDDFIPDGPGSLDQVIGDSAQGRWILYITDRTRGNAGILNTWGVRILGSGVVDDIENGSSAIPDKFAMLQNYPNPFNPSTKISFMLPDAGRVKLEIYDLLGRRVATLLDKDFNMGLHSVAWDGKAADGNAVSSGVYFARLSTGQNQAIIRMSLIK